MCICCTILPNDAHNSMISSERSPTKVMSGGWMPCSCVLNVSSDSFIHPKSIFSSPNYCEGSKANPT